MLVLEASRAAEVVKGRVTIGRAQTVFRGVSTDTRRLKPGELFVAIRGQHHDGHDFVAQAFAQGASAVLVDQNWPLQSSNWPGTVITCKQTVAALADLARYHLSRCQVRVAAITGSNGKTTTKELAGHMLAKTTSVMTAPASYNNAVGVPLTILQLEPHHRVLVLEMGTSARGEIRRLTRVAPPNVAAITSISQTHLEGLGSVQNVARAKAEILEGISANDVAVLNHDDPWCRKLGDACSARKRYFKVNTEADIFATDIRQTRQGLTFLLNGTYACAPPILGKHNVYNFLAATGICEALGLELREIPDLAEGFVPPPMRLEVRRLPNEVTLINDAYNANPKSMEAALEVLAAFDCRGRRIFVCGEMLELGSFSREFHRRLGAGVAASQMDLLFALGAKGLEVIEGALQAGFPPVLAFRADSLEELAETLRDALRPGDVALFKASRGVGLEKVVQKLEQAFATEKPGVNGEAALAGAAMHNH